MTRNRTPSYLRERLATNVKHLRSQAGITQEELADRTGLHRTYIGAIERAERNISLATLEALATGLKVDPSRLITKTPTR